MQWDTLELFAMGYILIDSNHSIDTNGLLVSNRLVQDPWPILKQSDLISDDVSLDGFTVREASELQIKLLNLINFNSGNLLFEIFQMGNWKILTFDERDPIGENLNWSSFSAVDIFQPFKIIKRNKSMAILLLTEYFQQPLSSFPKRLHKPLKQIFDAGELAFDKVLKIFYTTNTGNRSFKNFMPRAEEWEDPTIDGMVENQLMLLGVQGSKKIKILHRLDHTTYSFLLPTSDLKEKFWIKTKNIQIEYLNQINLDFPKLVYAIWHTKLTDLGHEISKVSYKLSGDKPDEIKSVYRSIRAIAEELLDIAYSIATNGGEHNLGDKRSIGALLDLKDVSKYLDKLSPLLVNDIRRVAKLCNKYSHSALIKPDKNGAIDVTLRTQILREIMENQLSKSSPLLKEQKSI